MIPIFVPPLRERQEDIQLLADHFMAEFAREYGRRLKSFEPAATAVIQRYAWPGNVRELRNVIERLMIMVPGDAISAVDLSFLDHTVPARPALAEATAERLTLHEARDRFERDLILRTLGEQQGNMSRTAGGAGRGAEQPVPQDADVRHRAVPARRRRRGRGGGVDARKSEV